jgi:hypothetical protein
MVVRVVVLVCVCVSRVTAGVAPDVQLQRVHWREILALFHNTAAGITQGLQVCHQRSKRCGAH